MAPSSGSGTPSTPSGRTHRAALDGLRGFAAASVVVFHLGHWLGLSGLASNSWLAVDLFFCLSGYVLSLAYQARLDAGMKTLAFMEIRLVRLTPLMILATLISVPAAVARLALKHQHLPISDLLAASLLGLVSLPDLWAPRSLGGPQVFPLNGPQFSLFFEIVVNLFWSVTRRFNGLPLCALMIGLCLGPVLRWGFHGDEAAGVWLGFPRVGLAFYLGVAVFQLERRLNGAWKCDWLFWSLAASMALLFYWPSHAAIGLDAVWLVAAAPVLVLLGAQVGLSPRLERLALLAGELSYPVYALQYPVFGWVNGALQVVLKGRDAWVVAWVYAPVLLGVSWLALRAFDAPLRAALSRRLRAMSASGSGRAP